jgi:hypothetical protein
MFKSAFQVTFAVELTEEDDEFETTDLEHITVLVPCLGKLSLFEFTDRLEDNLVAIMAQADIDEDAEVVAVEEVIDQRFAMLNDELEDESDGEESPDTPDGIGADSSEVTH